MLSDAGARVPLGRYVDLLGTYLRPQWPHVALLGGLLLGSIGLQLTFPQILRHFIDAAQAGADLGTLAGVALLYLGVALATQVVATGEAYVAASVGQIATNAMRSDLTLHCLRLDSDFHNARTPGELIERIDGDVGVLGNFFSRFVVDVLGNMLLLAAVLALLWGIDWRVGLAFSTVSLAGLAALRGLQPVPVRYRRAARQASAELYGFLEERLAGTEDIRSSGAVPYTMQRFFVRARAFLYAELKGRVAGHAVGTIASFVITLCMVLSFVMGAYLFRRGEITLGTVFLLLSYTQLLRRPIEQLNRQAQDLANASASIARIKELFAERSALVDGPLRLPPGPLSVEFDGVCFEYPDEGRRKTDDRRETTDDRRSGPFPHVPSILRPSSSLVLHDVSFRLAPGRVLGLLGRTGSGKTTVSRLLFRLYDPAAGAVRLNGVDLRQARVEDVRRRVGVVTQEVQLFHASVRDNLTFFDKTVPDDRLLEVLRQLELWPWYASLPDGLDTKLAPNSGGLSAGEAQLLAFVRVFLEDPGLVILDEASARLDPATERRIERAIDRLLGRGGAQPGAAPYTSRRTAVVIAHRLATIQRVDEILLLGNGRVLEHGSRAALAADPHSQFAALLRAGTGLEEVLA
jgi:ATP-binding cassette, subfamily B, bacterial